MIDRKCAEAAFFQYTSGYDPDNPMIRLKIRHTLRVAGICERIARSLGLGDGETGDIEPSSVSLVSPVDFAWLLGLLHDIGRFEQVRRYGTFMDSVSVDHAEFGADLLFGEGLIRSFYSGNLTAEELRLLERAIRLHNKLTLPGDLDDGTRIFCDIIRDADKVDIFRVVAELSFEERAGTSRDLLAEEGEACSEVMDCVLRHCCVPRSIRKNRFDVHISHCCMAFELVFPESRRLALEQGCLRGLLSDKDVDGRPLYSRRQCEQLRILENEIESVWGESGGQVP